ncbi:MAG: magnesium/cobalt transporter CorA [Spirochaetales bacterium]|nr:magnesium/cobalt transporter CorA [Spirochaetales bacterium]
MARFLKNKVAAIGKAPGELVFIGDQKVEKATIDLFDYDPENLSEQELNNIEEGIPYKDTDTVSWLNITGLHDTELIRQVGKVFGLHALVRDDIVNTGQRPKMQDYDEYIFFGIKMMHYDDVKGEIQSEQLSIVLGKNFLLTFQEKPGDIFEPVRNRIRKYKGRIRRVGVDYLTYVLLDTIIDNYFIIIERLGEQIEDIEDQILSNPNKEVLTLINNYKREMNFLRKAIRPVREFMLQLSKLDSELIQEGTSPFLKDLLTISNQAVETIDTYREMLSDHLNIYNTSVSNHLNEIMKFLTIFSAIFIPLTFIAGIYGTNFDFVPELHYRYSYFIMWGLFVLISLLLIKLFKRKHWL